MTEPIRRQRRRTLTDKMVAALPKKRKRYTQTDPEQRGMYVRVPPQGPNIFVAVARDPYGKQIWTTLGANDVLAIDEARDKARTAIKRVRAGLPAVEEPPVRPDAFASVAEDWLKRHVLKKKLRSQDDIERCLAKYVLPHWGRREFVSIRRSDVTRLLDHIEDNHGPRQADLVLAHIRKMMNWFASRSDDYVSPVVRGMRRVDTKARSKTLEDDELRAIWKQAEANGTFGALIRILLLTAQRRGAVLGMRWADISDDGVWKIAAEEREKGNAGALRLPQQALAIMNAQLRIDGNPFVFAAARGPGSLNGFSKRKAQFDRACGVSGWVLHDLRRSARSLMSRAGVRPDIAERVMGHKIVGVEGVYDRYAYLDEKADALVKLAGLIDQIINPPPDNVLAFPEGQRARANT